jgi:hypothetical protein
MALRTTNATVAAPSHGFLSFRHEGGLKRLQRDAIDEVQVGMNIREMREDLWRAGNPPACSAYFNAVLVAVVSYFPRGHLLQ